MKKINERNEEICARKFVNEYNKWNLSNYKAKRTEDWFISLANQNRWDFVAIDESNISEWIAIEIKQLIRKEADIQLDTWQNLAKKVTEEISASNRKAIKGTFLLIPGDQPVLYKMGGPKTKRLKNALKQILPSKLLTMKTGDNCDIGPDILEIFSEWPFVSDLQTKPKIEVVKKAEAIYLFKISGRGRKIEVPSMSDAFTSKEATSEALLNILPNNGDIANVCKQLRLAKEMGAIRTILLLDYSLPVRPDVNLIKQIMFKDQESLNNDVDETYLIDKRKNIVTKIHP